MDVLFVCLENVCRSPIAQAVAAARAGEEKVSAGKRHRFASAGVRVGMPRAPVDARARAALQRAGYAAQRHKARRVTEADFARHDLVVALDRYCLDALRAVCPPEQAQKLSLLMDWVPGGTEKDVPDPYFGPDAGFDLVVQLCERAVDELLPQLDRLSS
jgi:protein-tyrosine phosphatase